MRTIGVLALQGDFEKHIFALHSSGANTIEIRTPEQLKKCDGLIIPGGESTTLTKLISLYDFYKPLVAFGKKYPIMGTCAGLIMLSTFVDDERVTPLRLIDAVTSRNAYGRQIDSFTTPVEFKGIAGQFSAYFIRAPKIKEIGKDTNVLAMYQNTPIAIANKNILAMSFHPELGNDYRIHKMFIEKF